MPAEFDRVNWGVYGFGFIWALLYGPHKWVVAFLSAVIVPILADSIALFFFDVHTTYPAVVAVTSAAMGVAIPVLAAWYSAVVNRQVWARARQRFAADPDDFSRAIPMTRYRKSIEFWTRAFIAFVTIDALVSVYAFATGRYLPGGWQTTWTFTVLIGLWSYDRLRRSRAQSEQALQPDASASVHNSQE